MKNNTNFYYKFRFEYEDVTAEKDYLFCLHHDLKHSTPPMPIVLNNKLSLLSALNWGASLSGYGKRINDNVFWVSLSPNDIKNIKEELNNASCR